MTRISDRIDGDFPMSWNTRTIVRRARDSSCSGKGSAWAGPPQIGNISPSGVQRGVAGEVTFSGANLAGNPRLIAPFAFRAEPVDPKRSSAGGLDGEADRRARRGARGLPDPRPDRRRTLESVPVRGRPASAGQREGRQQHLRGGPVAACAAAGRRGSGRGQRCRLLQVRRQEGTGHRGRRPVRPDRLGRGSRRSG